MRVKLRVDFYNDSGHRLKWVRGGKYGWRGGGYKCALCEGHTNKTLSEIKQMIHGAAPCNCGQAMLFDGNYRNAPAWRLES